MSFNARMEKFEIFKKTQARDNDFNSLDSEIGSSISLEETVQGFLFDSPHKVSLSDDIRTIQKETKLIINSFVKKNFKSGEYLVKRVADETFYSVTGFLVVNRKAILDLKEITGVLE